METENFFRVFAIVMLCLLALQWMLKVRTLEKKQTEQQNQIDELKRELEDLKQER